VIFFSLSIFLLIGCSDNEEDDPWSKCYECTAESWIGEYNGSCDYFNYDMNITREDQVCTVEIGETATNYFEVKISSPNNFYAVLYGDFVTSQMINFSSSNSSVSATMYVNGQELRLTGNSKKFHYETPDTIPILVYDEVVNFELFKD
jgi:hypothetical protein